MKNRFALILATLIVGSLATNLALGEEKPYKIAIGPWVGFGPLYLAEEKGFFKKEGVKVELVEVSGLAERNTLLAAGRVDAMAAPIDYFALASGNRIPSTIVMAIDQSDGGDGLVVKGSIKNISQLRGKTIGIQKGFTSDFLLRALLKKGKGLFCSILSVS